MILLEGPFRLTPNFNHQIKALYNIRLNVKLQSSDKMKYFITQDALDIDSEEAILQMASYRN
jgi:hypothetical protein